MDNNGTVISQTGGLAYNRIANITNAYDTILNNGGAPNFPNVIGDDSKTTDEVVARRMNYPSKDTREYFADAKNLQNPRYTFEANRLATIGEKVEQLKLRGISIRGQEYYGGNNALILDSTGSYTPTVNSVDNGIGTMLWIFIGIGVIALVGSLTGQPIVV